MARGWENGNGRNQRGRTANPRTGWGGQSRPPLRAKRKPTQPMGTVITPAAGDRALHEAPLRRNGQSDKNTVGAIHESPASAVTTTTGGRVDGKRRQYRRRGRRPRRPGHGIGHRLGWSSPPHPSASLTPSPQGEGESAYCCRVTGGAEPRPYEFMLCPGAVYPGLAVDTPCWRHTQVPPYE